MKELVAQYEELFLEVLTGLVGNTDSPYVVIEELRYSPEFEILDISFRYGVSDTTQQKVQWQRQYTISIDNDMSYDFIRGMFYGELLRVEEEGE